MALIDPNIGLYYMQIRAQVFNTIDSQGQISATAALQEFEALPHGHQDKISRLMIVATVWLMALDGDLAEVLGNPGVFVRN